MYGRFYCIVQIVFISFLLVISAVVPVQAQEAQSFSDSFVDASLAGWEHSLNAIVADGVLRIEPGGFAAHPQIYTTFRLTVRFRYQGPGEVQISYFANDEGQYSLHLVENEIWLDKKQLQETTNLGASGAVTLQPGQEWIEIGLEVNSNHHLVFINAEPVITADDPDLLRPGLVVLAALGNATIEFDDFTIENLRSMHLPTEGIQPGSGYSPAALPPADPPAAQATAVEAIQVADNPDPLNSLLQQFATSQASQMGIVDFLINLGLAVITSVVLALVYTYWGSSISNRRKFASNFVLITVTTTFIILVVRSSVALSLGLVGALSIIRFRAAIKEPEELAYLFFAISLGIGLGDNQRLITLVTLAVVIAIIGLARLMRQTQADVNLHLTVSSRNPDKVEMQHVMEVLVHHTEKLRLLRYDETSEALEMSFVVEFRHISNLSAARSALQALSPVLELSFLDNKGIW